MIPVFYLVKKKNKSQAKGGAIPLLRTQLHVFLQSFVCLWFF